MTESQFQSKLRRALQARLPKAVIWKHNDRFTAGIPDLSVTCGVHPKRTTWIELKVGCGKLTVLQTLMLKRVEGYAITMSNKTWTIHSASEMDMLLVGWGTDFEQLLNCLVDICR